MDLANITSQRQVLDVFENLFDKYSNLTELPKLKKRRISQVGKSKVCEKQPNLSPLHQSSVHSTAKHPRDHTGEASLHAHAKDQGSFSSGVFSIDSDCIDNINDEDDDEDSGDGDKSASVDHEENSSSSETSSEAGSGIVERSLREVSSSRNKPDEEKVNHNEILQEATEGTGKLTDEDVLFMMHKPRLKKRRKKPPWQRRTLDLDDLWVKGQHLQLDYGSDLEEEVATKLFLDRNLRWGKISLQNYICAMRKSRKGKKRLKSSNTNMSTSKKRFLKETSCGDNSSVTSVTSTTSNSRLPRKRTMNEVPVGNLQRATALGSGGKKQSVKPREKEARKPPRYMDVASDNTSDSSEQDFRPMLQARAVSHASSKAKHGSESASIAKEEKGKRTGRKQRASTKPKESKAELVSTKSGGRLRKTVVAKDCRVSSGSRASSTSRGTASSLIDTDTVSADTMTQKGHSQRSRKNSRTSSERTKPCGNKKSSSAPTPGRSKEWDNYDVELEENGESQESTINFISLTPRKSSKSYRRRQRSAEKRKAIPASTSDSSDFDGYSRSVSLHSRASLLVPAFPLWEDEEEEEFRPLFGKGRHCGGVWNTIVEESS